MFDVLSLRIDGAGGGHEGVRRRQPDSDCRKRSKSQSGIPKLEEHVNQANCRELRRASIGPIEFGWCGPARNAPQFIATREPSWGSYAMVRLGLAIIVIGAALVGHSALAVEPAGRPVHVRGAAAHCISLQWDQASGYDGRGWYLKIGSGCSTDVRLHLYWRDGGTDSCVSTGILEGAPLGGTVKASSERDAKRWNAYCAEFRDDSYRCSPRCQYRQR